MFTSRRGQGAFEYLLLLGGTVLVATVVTVMAQGSVLEANNALNASSNDFDRYVRGGVNDLIANGSLVHELPTGCTYSNPPCVDGYFCDNGACVQMNSLLSGYVFDPSGLPLSGATVFLVNGTGFNATTSSTGYYDLSASSALPSNWYAVAASRVPSSAQSTVVVNLTVGFGAFRNFTLSYNPATLSGFVRDPSGNGITGVSLTCGPYSATSITSGAYSISNVPMSSASIACTLAGSKSPTFVSNSTSTSFNAGVVNSQDLQLSYAAASMSGYVRNPSSVGIGGATVTCGSYSATTASDGSYLISNVSMSAATSACTLAASKSPTFVSGSASVAFIAGTSVSQSLQLSYSGASVSGYVRNPASVGISGATVSCAGYSATTAGDGSYTISGVAMSAAASTCTLAASKSPAFVSNSAPATLTAGATTSSQNLQLSYATASVSGYIRDASSTGISGASVSCAGYSATTAGDGSYSISGIAMSAAASTCTLAASKSPTFVSSSASVSLTAGATSSQNAQLAYSTAAISGYIRDSSGSGISGASVSCAGYSATTSSGGSYSISGIAMSSASTTCTLSASKSGYTAASATASLSAGSASSGQNLQLASSGFQLNFESGIGSWTSIMTSICCSYLYINPVSAGRGAYSMESHGYNTGCGSAHATSVDYYMSPVSGNTFRFSLKWVQAGTPNYANYILGVRGVNAAGAKKWMAYRFRYGHGGGGYGTWYFDWTYWHTDQCAMVDIVDPASGTWYDFTRTLSSDFSACGFVPVSYDAIGITEGAWAGNEYWYLDDVSIQ